MGVVSVISKIVALRPVEIALSKLVGKLFGQGRGGSKMAAGLSVATIVAVAVAVAKSVDPGLGEILAGNEATLVAFVGVVQAIYMYYRREVNL